MEADALGSTDDAGIAELEQVDIQPARSWLDSQVKASNGSPRTMLELRS